MRRFFIHPDDLSGTRATITGDEAHHISDVLRLKSGTVIELFDGTGKTYQATIDRFAKGRVEAVITATALESDAASHLAIGVALVTGKKMDLVVQKATELGVETIIPYVSRHCSVKKGNPNKEERWQRIALEACKQCNRPTAPQCLPVTDFTALLDQAGSYSQKIIFWEQEQARTMGDLFTAGDAPPDSVLALFGPEGGFSNEEVSKAVAAGFTTVSLGKRILRAETAVISGSAILQFLLGNLHADHQ